MLFFRYRYKGLISEVLVSTCKTAVVAIGVNIRLDPFSFLTPFLFIQARYKKHDWEVIVEPDDVYKLLVVVTAYPVWDD